MKNIAFSGGGMKGYCYIGVLRYLEENDMVKNIANKNTFDNEPWRAYNAMPSAFLVNGRNTSFKFVADAVTPLQYAWFTTVVTVGVGFIVIV